MTSRESSSLYRSDVIQKKRKKMLRINEDALGSYGVGARRLIRCHAQTDNKWCTPGDHRRLWLRFNGGKNVSTSSVITSNRNIWNRRATARDLHPVDDPDRDGCELDRPHFLCTKEQPSRGSSRGRRGRLLKLYRVRPQLARRLFVYPAVQDNNDSDEDSDEDNDSEVSHSEEDDESILLSDTSSANSSITSAISSNSSTTSASSQDFTITTRKRSRSIAFPDVTLRHRHRRSSAPHSDDFDDYFAHSESMTDITGYTQSVHTQTDPIANVTIVDIVRQGFLWMFGFKSPNQNQVASLCKILSITDIKLYILSIYVS